MDSPPKDRKEIIIIIIRILRYWIISNLTERALPIKRLITLKEVNSLKVIKASLEVDYLTILIFQATHQLKWKEVQGMVRRRINSSSKIFIWIWTRALDLQTTPTTCPSLPWVLWRAPPVVLVESIYQIIKTLKFKIKIIRWCKFNL